MNDQKTRIAYGYHFFVDFFFLWLFHEMIWKKWKLRNMKWILVKAEFLICSHSLEPRESRENSQKRHTQEKNESCVFCKAS